MNTPKPKLMLAMGLALIIAALPMLAHAEFGDPEGWNPNPEERTVYPDWFVDSFLDLPEDLANARTEGKKGIMVVFSMPFCSHCKQLIKTTFADETIVAKLRRDFDAVHVDLFSDAEMVSPKGEPMRVKEFGKREGADFTPAIYFYDLDGNRMLRVIGYQPPDRFSHILSYLSEGHYRESRLRDYLARKENKTTPNKVIPRIDDPLFEGPPFALDRRIGPAPRQTLIVFDGPDCDECPYVFGELFQHPRLRKQLQQLEVMRVRLDEPTPILRPDGSVTTAAQWHAELGLHRTPALLFLNERGEQVMLTDAMLLPIRLDNTLGFVLERAYEKGWNYQRFASMRSGERKAAARDANGG
ncbi:MAG: thioredoxin fold domain-containing protein [Gammaproteobacteria bacterium]